MEVHFPRDVEKKLIDQAAKSGYGTAWAGYLDEVTQTQNMLDTRHDDLKIGWVNPIDGEEAFSRLKANTEAQRNRPA